MIFASEIHFIVIYSTTGNIQENYLQQISLLLAHEFNANTVNFVTFLLECN